MTRDRPATARLAAVCTAVLLSGCSPGQTERGWECLAPANAGGGWDLTCRAVGRVLEEMSIAPGLVRTTNLPGAGGGVGFARTVAQRSDDPNLLVAASPSTVLRLAQRQYGDLNEDDVRWVGALGAEYAVFAVAPDAPWQSLGDLVATLREEPGSVIVSGGSAVAGQDHMKVLLLAQRAGVDPLQIRYVPFDGGGEAMTALLGGFVHLFAGEASEIEAQVEAGRLRALAVLAPERLSGPLADVPTARESGIDLTWITWRGFYVPRDIGDEAYARWVEVIRRVGSSDAWAEARRQYRLEPFFVVGEEFDRLVHEQVADFRTMSREIGLIR
jgi:putative tricarboxylic transport membrane protein